MLLRLCVLGLLGIITQIYSQTELHDYVNRRDDDIFGWQLNTTYHYENYTIYMLNVTSLRWLDESYSDRTAWYHWVGVAVPVNLQVTDSASLYYVGGSSNRPTPPSSDDGILNILGQFSFDTGAIHVYLNNIPNQPIQFTADEPGKRRSNDPAIAWTMKQWTLMDNMTSPPELLLYFPMVKGGVRVIDAVVEFVQQTFGHTLSKWIVAGPSKWGWTSWLHAAVDSRVVALIPMVMNLLNMDPCFDLMHKSLGGWTFVLNPYWSENVTTIHGIQGQRMNQLIDPYEYREYLDKPKLILMATSDEYFFPENTWYWLDDMPGDNIIWLLENSNHYLVGQWNRSFTNMITFTKGIHSGFTFPKATWTRNFTETGAWLELHAQTVPIKVTGYRANATHYDTLRRDYRWFRKAPETDPDPDVPAGTDIWWFEETPQQVAHNKWRLEFENPERGWEAFFMEMEYDGPDGDVFLMSTEVQITPDTYPYPSCEPGPGCKSVLV